jgi:hypothetical protein
MFSGDSPYIRCRPFSTMWAISKPNDGSYATTAGLVAAIRCECPSSCCSPSPLSVVGPAVAPSRKPRDIWSAAAHRPSAVRWNPNIE